MKILHTSDWHLGINISGYSLIEEQRYVMQQLIKIVEENKIHAVVIAGDIYDTAISKAEAIALYADTVTEICLRLKVPVIVIAGNHDSASRLAQCNEMLSKVGLHIVGKLDSVTAPIEINDTQFFTIPFFNIDEGRLYVNDKNIETYDEAMQKVASKMLETSDESKVKVCISHSFVRGGEVGESDKSASIGTLNIVSKNSFNGFDYTLLGHLHKPQDLGGNIMYSGTPMQYSFSEKNQQKGVVIIDTDSQKVERIDLPQLRTFEEIKVAISDISTLEPSENYVKIVLSGGDYTPSIYEKFKSLYPKLCMVVTDIEENQDINNFTLSYDEIKTLNPQEMLIRFNKEIYNIEPSQEELNMFNEAVQELVEE